MLTEKQITLLLVVGFLILVSVQIDNFVTDEPYWPTVAHNILYKGIPEIQYGENRDPVLVPFNPPLLPYTLSVAFFLGLPEIASKIVMILLRLATIPFVFLIAREIGRHKKITILALLIFLFSPYALQSALILDEDPTLLTLLMTIFVYLVVRFKTLTVKRTLPLAGVVALALLTKPIQPFLLILALLIFFILKKDKRQTLLALWAGILGTILFLALWAGNALLTGLPPLGFLNYGGGAIPDTGLVNYLLFNVLFVGIKIHGFWLIPAFVFLLLFMFSSEFKKFRQTKTLQTIHFVYITAALLIIFAVLGGQAAWKFPVYFFPAFPLLSILVADYILTKKLQYNLTTLLAFCIPIIIHLLVLPDPLLPPKTIPQTIIMSLLYLVPLAVVFGLLYLKEQKQFKETFITACIIVFFSTLLYLTAIHLTAPYSTGFNYGEEGFSQTVEYLKQNAPDAALISPWDIAYSSGNRFYEPDRELNTQNCIPILEKWPIEYVVLRGDWDMKYRPVFFQCLKENYEEVHFGNFFIYKVK